MRSILPNSFPGSCLRLSGNQPGPLDQPDTNKTVFLADSVDNGKTWTNLRQLTSVHGQCHGAGVGLSNNRAGCGVRSPLPRELGSGRAMVSNDNGKTWSDEVYYLCHGHVAGFPRHISLDGEEILTFIGSCYGDVSKWENATGNSHSSASSGGNRFRDYRDR